MKISRRKFLKTSGAVTTAGVLPAGKPVANDPELLHAYQVAKRHLIIRNGPSPNFFEGMLLGNGDIGVCAVLRPDALGLHLGKSDAWDIRVSEDIERYVLTFPEILKLWERASEEAKRLGKPDMLFLESSVPFFREYTDRVASSYARAWPRPWPCGTIWVHWDPRWVRAGRQTLDPSNGLLTVELTVETPQGGQSNPVISCFVDWATGLISVSTDGAVPFSSLCYYPALDQVRSFPLTGQERSATTGLLPPPEIDGKVHERFAEFACQQQLPATGPTDRELDPPQSDRDRNFSVFARVTGSWALEELLDNQNRLKEHGQQSQDGYTHYTDRPGIYLRAKSAQRLRLDLKIVTPRDILLDRLELQAAATGEKKPWILINQNRSYSAECAQSLARARQEIGRLAELPVSRIQKDSEACWKRFWSRSAVEFEDKELERIWYHNQYFLACCLRERKTAPGLFGNWSFGAIGTAWHSDYHMDYNTQQVFWGVFSSNHVDQHLPYVELCHNLLAMSERYAREKFNLPGAYFPHSAYPVPSQMVPYPVPPWGYQISETPWTVQSLWWQYLYTQDIDYLRHVYPILRAAAEFMTAYVQKGEDGKYHVTPTVSSENWGFTVGYRLNKDCILDLSLTAFLLDAVIEGSTVLQTDSSQRARWKEVWENLAPYPKAEGPHGEVWRDVADGPLEYIYNVPLTLAPVFPAEQVGLGRGEDQLGIARRTARTVRLEGGNDLVFQPMIRARLGVLNLRWFKRQVRYCLLPNGACGDRVRQVGGRYNDSTDFDFMMHMGIWTENLALPVVLNECLLQSYTGTIRLFPNTQNLKGARFVDLRAVGAFLISADYDGKSISQVSLLSEKGKPVRLVNPWPSQTVRVTRARDGQNVSIRKEKGALVFPTEAGERYRIEPSS